MHRCSEWMCAPVALVALLLSWAHGAEPEAESADTAAPRRMATTEEAIRFFQARVDRNPRDMMSRTYLGRLLVRLTRETGDDEHTKRAEAELRKVLEDRPGDATAQAWLATALLAQHRFAEARELAENVYREHPGSTHALATIGDACLELGRYDEAQTAYAKLEQAAPVAEVLARLAHLAELQGRTGEAIRLLQAAGEKERRSNPESTELAWYEFRLGEVHLVSGQLDAAARHFESALEQRKDYQAALLALGQVRALQGRYSDAIPLYERAVELKPEFDTIAELALVHARAGHDDVARQLDERAESLVPEAAKQETEARHLSLYLSDRDQQLEQALALARQDLKVRQDVHAWDTLAWALYKNGKLDEASAAAREALKLGTKDATLYFHAALIARGAGRTDEARRLLTQALELNPRFSLRHADEARRVLDELNAAAEP